MSWPKLDLPELESDVEVIPARRDPRFLDPDASAPALIRSRPTAAEWHRTGVDEIRQALARASGALADADEWCKSLNYDNAVVAVIDRARDATAEATALLELFDPDE
jgi:hypothetical protein